MVQCCLVGHQRNLRPVKKQRDLELLHVVGSTKFACSRIYSDNEPTTWLDYRELIEIALDRPYGEVVISE